jgi:hypothetical protein
MERPMNLATYTKAEGAALEDHYIQCAKREGIWGKGRPPSNDAITRRQWNVTPAGRARIRKAMQSKEMAYKLICQGHDTVKKVSQIMKRTDTPVRRYFRELHKEGRIKIVHGKNGCQITWKAI